MEGFSMLNVMGSAPNIGENDAEVVDEDEEGKENKEEPKEAKVWLRATMWECSMWYFKPFKFL